MKKYIGILLMAGLLTACGESKRQQQHSRQETVTVTDTVETDLHPTEGDAEGPVSWQRGVERLGNRYHVQGIWRMKDIGTTLIIYERDGQYYLNTCQIQSPIISTSQEQPLERQDGYTYIHREEGSDMPEKYVIQDRTMQSFIQNPQSGNWSPLATYYTVWEPGN